ncbi:MAG: hypothetical protein BA874_01615 [Desulfuromonadales bacterium C00003068]|nr:MAG: hypothetical protein BA874_01615 [Desulfuromonadales bacterium C00003068]
MSKWNVLIVSAPNLMIVGAPRSGTTFLWASLAQSDDVFAPPVKEPHFHLADRWPLGGPESTAFTKPLAAYLAGRKKKVWGGLMTRPQDYAALYAPGATANWRIEATPNYFAEGHMMAERLSERLGPETRILVTLRDPVERAMSHYRLFCRTGWETLSFEAALAAGPERCATGWAPTWDYLRYSLIAEPLAAWRKVFGDRLQTVTLDAQRYTPFETMERISSWLGLSNIGIAPKSKHNAAGNHDKVSYDAAKAAMVASGRIDLEVERSALTEIRATEPPLPIVSIGMPVRNGAASISKALNSLQAQSYPALDIVVCDNASTDETPQIAAKYAEQDPRISLQRFETSVDIQDSYRRALDSRKGPYFMFAPADDSWSPEFIDSAVCRMQVDRTLSACCGHIEMVSDDGELKKSRGTRSIKGRPQQRWRRGLLRVSDASRLYGLLRSDRLDGLIPSSAPQGWDHYSAAKIALRGAVAKINITAMRRHQTPASKYKEWIDDQEPTLRGRASMARHVIRLCRADAEIKSFHPAAQMVLWSYFCKHAAQNLPRSIWFAPARLIAIIFTYILGVLAWVIP